MSNLVDLRVLKTEESIKKTFKNMLLEMPYEKMTIKELCEKSRINRKTFYLHYHSLDEVLEKIQDEQTSEYFERIKDFDHITNVDKLISIFFHFSEEKGEFFEKIHTNSNYDYIHKQSNSKVSVKSQDNLKSIRKFDTNKQNIVISYINNSIIGIYKKWIEDGKKMPIQEVINLATVLIKSGIDKILT